MGRLRGRMCGLPTTPYHVKEIAMAGRKKSQRVVIMVKDRGTVSLMLTATDKDTIYLNGTWKYLTHTQEDIYEDDGFLDEVLRKSKDGKFVRQKDKDILDINGTFIRLLGVDEMHGLALGGHGKAAIAQLGSQDWRI